MSGKEIIGYGKRGPIFKIRGAADEDPIERLKKRQTDILAELEVLNEEIDEADQPETRSGKQTEFDKLQAEFDKNEEQLKELRAEIANREARSQRLAAARAQYSSVHVHASVGNNDASDMYELDMRSVFAQNTLTVNDPGHETLISRSLKIIDDKAIAPHLDARNKAHIESVLRKQNSDTNGKMLSAYLIATANPAYRSAFQKATGSLHPVFTPEEGRAVTEVQMLQRAMAIGASATGGFAVPVIIDPTVILTAQGSSNWILNNARVETITNDRWKGLSSAGVTWKFDAEAATANDNSPTLTQPEVVTYRADGFIPYSIEVGQDWPGFAEEMSRMLGSGYRELLAEKLATGSAANTPRGLVSRLVLQTSPDVSTATTTAGTIAGADIYAMWARLPERHRDSASWLSSTSVQNAIRQLGTVDPNFTVNITDDAIARMFGRQYGLTDYMDSAASGTAAANQLIVGDMKGYLVAQRAGMSIEFVPMLFDVTNNRPTGQRGWFAYARVGADVVNPTAFQLLQNKTS